MSRGLFEKALAEESGVTDSMAKVAFSIYAQESGAGRNTTTSNRGAVGGMQLLPSTFREVADKDWDINNPVHNIRAGLRYLKKLDLKAQGDPALLAAGYYGGPGGLEKARRGVAVSDPKNPHAPNTLEYAQQVVGRLAGGGTQVSSLPTPVGRRSDGGIQPVVGGPGASPVPSLDGPVPVASGQGVPLPPELLNYLASRGRVPAGQVLPAAQNAWLSFLNTARAGGLPTGQPTTPMPVQAQPQDIDYMGVLRAPRIQPVVVPDGRVNFAGFTPFGAFGKRGVAA